MIVTITIDTELDEKPVEQAMRQMCSEVAKNCRYNFAKTSKTLGLSRATVSKYMHRHAKNLYSKI